MKCSVLRSASRDYTFIYLRDGFLFEDLPEELRNLFGEPVKVLDLELSPDRKLAQEDPVQVLNNLQQHGYHLQLPPKDDSSGWLDLPPSNPRLID